MSTELAICLSNAGGNFCGVTGAAFIMHMDFGGFNNCRLKMAQNVDWTFSRFFRSCKPVGISTPVPKQETCALTCGTLHDNYARKAFFCFSKHYYSLPAIGAEHPRACLRWVVSLRACVTMIVFSFVSRQRTDTTRSSLILPFMSIIIHIISECRRSYAPIRCSLRCVFKLSNSTAFGYLLGEWMSSL